MDSEEIVSVVSKLGFPVASAVAFAIFLGYIFVQTRRDAKDREDLLRNEYNEREQRLYEQNERLNETLGRATETIDRMNIRLDVIEDKIDDLKAEVRSK